ncbi:unnamed protein product [Schistosoma curassoni]|uniref:Uncharacterized protein n=1 Tax=Schistosoma curassoni TaxID=6186 RepID=A0A183KX77_9TREM|nr:unnamed protein product [Schistosoma curassoni]
MWLHHHRIVVVKIVHGLIKVNKIELIISYGLLQIFNNPNILLFEMNP